jgi:hypothetical protein
VPKNCPLYKDIDKVLINALCPLDDPLDYRLLTGSTWDKWANDLDRILSGLDGIDGSAIYLNADWHRRQLELSESKKHEGTWPHHFLVHYHDECEGFGIYCERCRADNTHEDLRDLPCILQHYNVGMSWLGLPNNDIPF